MSEQPEKCVALYIRSAQHSDDAIALPKAELLRHAQEQGYTNVSLYIDNGQSGLNPDRPGFSRLRTDIENGLVGMVLVRDMTRLSRNYLSLSGFMNILKLRGVGFATLDGSHRLKETFERVRGGDLWKK
jgi:DNA invertase Pin-like site-specific DNA recombinase